MTHDQRKPYNKGGICKIKCVHCNKFYIDHT